MMTTSDAAQNGAAPIDSAMAKSLLAPAVAVMISDGRVTQTEIDQFGNMVAYSPVLKEIGGKGVGRLFREIFEDIRAEGVQATLEAASERLTPKLRETSMCFAVRLAMADGLIDSSELATLTQTADAMGVPTERFAVIYDVMSIMQARA